jgi:hypothetical protein
MEPDYHNIEKFRSQQIEHYKRLRIDKLKDLDVEFFKALENGDVEWQKEIKEKKNKLRDIPNYEFPDFEDPRDILDHFPDFIL